MKKSQQPVKQSRKIKRRRLLFIFITVFIFPAFLVLTLESGLRLFGYGYGNNLVRKCTISSRDYLCNNDSFSRPFFTEKTSGEFVPFAFAQKKQKITYRIFIFGGSAAKGEPDSAYSFGRILEIMLESKYPTTDFEIINTALTAINSHVVLKQVRECVKYEPDAFIVYMGNNEVVGPYGAGTIFSPVNSNIGVIRASIFVKGTKIGQLLSSIFENLQSEKSYHWGGMEMFAERLVRFDDKGLKIVYRHFEKNVDDICKTSDSKKIPLVLCTVPVNIKDCPPFASSNKSSLTGQEKEKWDNFYKEGIEKEEQLLYDEAIECYIKALDIDECFADLLFRLGRCFFLLGQYEKAREHFSLALEYDALRFRADSTINRIIKNAADEKKYRLIYLADAQKALADERADKMPGNELFYEHVHLNFTGSYNVARTVFRQVEKFLPEQIKENADPRQITEQLCRNSLAFTDWDRYRTEKVILDEYISRPPFTNQLYNDGQVEELQIQNELFWNFLTEQKLNNYARVYTKAIANRPDDWVLRYNYALLLSDALGDCEQAAEQMQFVVEKVPHNYQAAAQLGVLYSRLGNQDKGLDYLKDALSIRPTDSICFNTALVYQMQGNCEDAINYYKRTVELNPYHGKAWSNMTALLGEMNRFDEAIKLCRQALKNLPDDKALNLGLAALLILDDRKEEAVQQLIILLKIDPGNAQAQSMLEKLTVKVE